MRYSGVHFGEEDAEMRSVNFGREILDIHHQVKGNSTSILLQNAKGLPLASTPVAMP